VENIAPLIAYFLSNISAKYENPTGLSRVTGINTGDVFLRHCRYTGKGVFQRNPQSKIYGDKAFKRTHLHTTVINSGRAHTTQLRTHCGASLSTDYGYNPG